MHRLPENLMLSDGNINTTTGKAARYAARAGHAVANLMYPGDGLNDLPFNAFLLGDKHLRESNRYLLRANKSMHRSWPRQQMASDNGLRRDLYTVRWADRIYIMGLFTQDASLLKIHTECAWAAQMYVDRFLYDQEPYDLCELYLFDMKSECWWLWNKRWAMISNMPKPRGVYTVVGHDKLTNAGKKALADLWD